MDQVFAATLDAPEVRTCLERHRAFWVRGAVDRPLQAHTWGCPLVPAPTTQGHELTPEMVSDGLQAGLDQMEKDFAKAGVLDGDLFRCATVPGSPPWMPAILGCRIRVFPSSNTHWREPLPGGWKQLRAIRADSGRAWRDVLREGLRQVVARFGGRYPIAALHARGPVDMLAHALGETEMCYRLADDPDGIREVLARLTALWIAVAEEVAAIVPSFAGGHFHLYGLWAPGSVAAFAMDASNILSPEQYHQSFLPFDRQIAASFDHVLIHTHSASAQHYASWLTIPHLAIQIADDPAVRIPWPELLVACRRIQEAGHPLMLLAQDGHYQKAVRHLVPAGLALRGYRPY